MGRSISDDGRVAFVTGGGGDLGRALAGRLARAGLAVAVADIDKCKAEATLKEFQSSGVRARALRLDVTQAGAFETCIDQIERELGPLAVLVNNAGLEGDVAPIDAYPEAVFDQVMGVNVKGVFLGTKLALSRMLRRNAGCVVNIASTSAIRGRRGLTAYVASKHAVLGLTRVAALDVAGTGVRVNAVLPGPVEGQMIRRIEQKAGGGIERSGPAPLATPHDVANSVAFLASDEAKQINGEALVIDGGATVM